MAQAATLERLDYATPEALGAQFPPAVIEVPLLESDKQVRLRTAQFIGAAAVGGCAETSRIEAPIASLHDALHRAAEGDQAGRRLVETNVSTDVIERTIKTGHVMQKTPLMITKEGKLLQYGQTMDSIQANSLRLAADHPVMRARTEAEARNACRIEHLNNQSYFDDYSFVVFSRAENLPEFGFFTETMSVSMQVTSKQADGLALESAFVSGVAQPGGKPHDEATILRLGRMLGVDLSGKTAAEIIDTPLLIHNSLLPNGVIDLVQMYDQAAGGTFFGEDRQPHDYLAYLQSCHEREQTFAPRVRRITAELIAAAREIDTPLTAVRLLHDISEKHMVKQAIVDTSIDSRVFGQVSGSYIEQARRAVERGDLEVAEAYGRSAIKTADSSSCPSAIREKSDDTKTADCEFISKKCPLCEKRNVKTIVKKIGRHTRRISGSCGCSTIASA